MILAMDEPVFLGTIACGLISYLIFKTKEPRKAVTIVSLLVSPPIFIAWSQYYLFRVTPLGTTLLFLRSLAIYLTTLSVLTISYRLSPFHPLASYPGPVIAKVTRLWAAYIAYTGRQPKYYKSLHERYGPYVRTGPNHLFICDSSLLPEVMAARPFVRGERYQLQRLEGSRGSLITILDPDEHAQRRKIWERGLNMAAIQEYTDALAKRTQQFLNILEKRQGMNVDVSGWLSCLSFDFMGDLAFGGAFHLLDAGKDKDTFPPPTRAGSNRGEVLATIPWFNDFFSLFRLNGAGKAIRAFSKQSVLNRKAKGSARKDLFYYLLDEAGLGNEPPTLPTLTNEAGLAIIAGSDTTGTALANLFYFLLTNPTVYENLQAEIDKEFPQGTDIFGDQSTVTMRDMKYLNAVINETLRLRPAVPSGIQRRLPKGSGGALLGERFLPEGTTVQIAAYSVHQTPKYFAPEPEKWIPERWFKEGPGHVLNHSAFFPFSYGPTNCVGKNLAIYEMRTVTCAMIQKFEFEFAPGYDIAEWEKKLEDNFIYVKGELPVRVKVRW